MWPTGPDRDDQWVADEGGEAVRFIVLLSRTQWDHNVPHPVICELVSRSKSPEITRRRGEALTIRRWMDVNLFQRMQSAMQVLNQKKKKPCWVTARFCICTRQEKGDSLVYDSQRVTATLTFPVPHALVHSPRHHFLIRHNFPRPLAQSVNKEEHEVPWSTCRGRDQMFLFPFSVLGLWLNINQSICSHLIPRKLYSWWLSRLLLQKGKRQKQISVKLSLNEDHKSYPVLLAFECC